jgi:hypothetical protein
VITTLLACYINAFQRPKRPLSVPIQLLVPDNIALLYSTPALCIGVEPGGKRLGNLSANKLCAVVWDPCDVIVEACRKAQTFLTDDPDRIRSIGTRQWASVNGRNRR